MADPSPRQTSQRHRPARVAALGWTALKGCSWLEEEELTFNEDGVPGDRLWSPVTHDLRCVKATDVPQLAGLRVRPMELPGPFQHLLAGGRMREVRYYDRTFSAVLHEGPLAQRVSEVVGQPVWLAHARARRGFVWSSPVSLLLASQLQRLGLPTDHLRYRPNVVLDDLADPWQLEPGDRLQVGCAQLVVERELDRCIVIDHHPTTGEKDQSLMKRLDPGALLGLGCTVEVRGSVRLGDGCRVL